MADIFQICPLIRYWLLLIAMHAALQLVSHTHTKKSGCIEPETTPYFVLNEFIPNTFKAWEKLNGVALLA